MIAIEVRGLGAAVIRVGDSRITLSQERVFKTLFYLAVRAGERVPRTELVETLWGSEVLARGRQSLRQMLYRLRQMGVPLDESGETVRLDPADVTCDVADALSDGWAARATVEEVWAAADLLPGTSYRTTPGFEEWLDGLRARVASQFRRAALRHIAEARRSARWRDVEELALRVLHSDPLNEEATLARAEALAMQGSKAMALDVLDAYAKELGERNDRIGLPARVLRRRIGDGGWDRNGQASTGYVPLVGREDAIHLATTLFENQKYKNRAALLLRGPSGIGKTRLAREMAAIAELAGLKCVDYAPSGAEHSIFQSEFARKLGAAILPLPGAAGADPTSIGILSRICSGGNEAQNDGADTTGAITYGHIAHALAEVITSVSEEQALLFVVEDTHRLTSNCTSFLGEVLERTNQARATWLFTTRSDRHADTHEKRLADHIIELPLLSLAEGEELARRTAEAKGIAPATDDFAQIARFANGHPQTIITACGLLSSSRPSRIHTSSLKALAHSHLATLNPRGLEVLHLIALLGPYATPRQVQIATSLDEHAFSTTIEELLNTGIVSVSHDGRISTHDSWYDAIASYFSAAVTALRAASAADSLEASCLSTADPALLIHTARLHSQSGRPASAVRMLLRASVLLDERGLVDDAHATATEALSVAHDTQLRHEILHHLAMYCHRQGRLEAALAHCAAYQSTLHVSSRMESTRALRIAVVAADATWKLNRDFSRHLQLLVSLLHLGTGDDDAFYSGALAAIRISLVATHSSLADEIHNLARARQERSGLHPLGTLVSLIFFAERGPVEALRRAVIESEGQSALPAPAPARALSFRYRSIAWRYLGDIDRASNTAEEGFAFASRSGLAVESHLMASQSLFLFLDAEDLESARRWLTRAELTVAYSPGPERLRALLFAKSRLFIQESKFEECLALYSDIDIDADAQYMPRRFALESSCVALALCNTGRTSEAIERAYKSLEVALATDSSQHLDCAVEYSCITLNSCGLTDSARSSALDYLSTRDRVPDRFLARHFRFLSTCRNLYAP
jgi:DNA-binding SARP family transcriptional activator/predicted transcriptional regulator